MIYASKIAELRAQSGDIKRRKHVDWTGDAAITVFQMPDDCFPVFDDTSTYAVRVNGTLMTESTQYTLDKTSGTLTLVSTPGNGIAISIDSICVYLLDSEWMSVINDTISSMGDDFWKEFVEGDITTTAGALEIDIIAQRPKCIAIYEFQHRKNLAEQWRAVEEMANWRFDRENNKIYVGRTDVFTVTGELLRIRGLESYILGTVPANTVDVQDRFMTIVEYGALARYWRWRYKHAIDLISKMSTESSRTPLQELVMLSDRFDRLYEQEKARLKPQKPPRVIPRYLEGGGRP